jgi:hypothetical protein
MSATMPVRSAREIRLGATIDGNDAALIEHVVPLVDFVEITPDRWASFKRGRGPRIESTELDVLAEISRVRPLLLHGVGLSIASHDQWNGDYVSLLEQLFEHPLHIAWHSEHLSFSRVDGEPLGTMVEPPWSAEVLELIVPRIDALQTQFGVPFLVEHVVRAFAEDEDDTMNTAEFLNAVTRRTGCGLLLDVYNLECDQHNFGLDPLRLLDELDLGAVREIHVAGGVMYGRYKVDIHSRVVAESTLLLLERVLQRAQRAEVVVFEVLKEAIPAMGLETLSHELQRLRGRLHAPL